MRLALKIPLAPVNNLMQIAVELENLKDSVKIETHLNKSVEKIILTTETSSKVHKLRTYEQVISDLIHTRQ